MLPKGSIKKLAAIGLAAAAVAPAGAAARPAVDAQTTPAPQQVVGQAVAAGGGSGLNARDIQSIESPTAAGQDLRAPDQVGGGLPPAAQDLRAPDQVTPTAPRGDVLRTVGHARPDTSSDGIDTGVWIGLGAFALAGLMGLGFVLVRARTRSERPDAVA
jgi:hypothetical protein